MQHESKPWQTQNRISLCTRRSTQVKYGNVYLLQQRHGLELTLHLASNLPGNKSMLRYKRLFSLFLSQYTAPKIDPLRNPCLFLLWLCIAQLPQSWNCVFCMCPYWFHFHMKYLHMFITLSSSNMASICYKWVRSQPQQLVRLVWVSEGKGKLPFGRFP